MTSRQDADPDQDGVPRLSYTGHMGYRIFLLCPLFFLCVLPSWSQSPADRDKIMRQIQVSGARIENLKIAETWATAEVLGEDSGGYVIVHFLDGRWQVVGGAGGACSFEHAYVLGIPPRLWRQLLGTEPSTEERRAILAGGPYWTKLTTKRTLTESDLSGYSWFELTLARNEIFAAHGREFRDPELRAYFQSRPWYRPDAGYHDGLLSKLELRNAKFIHEYQKRTSRKQ